MLARPLIIVLSLKCIGMRLKIVKIIFHKVA